MKTKIIWRCNCGKEGITELGCWIRCDKCKVAVQIRGVDNQEFTTLQDHERRITLLEVKKKSKPKIGKKK